MRVYVVVCGRGVAVAVGYVVRRWRSWPCAVRGGVVVLAVVWSCLCVGGA